MTFHAMAATTTEGKPSTRKSRRQGAMGPSWPSLMMSQAREEAKVVASGAAVIGMLVFDTAEEADTLKGGLGRHT